MRTTYHPVVALLVSVFVAACAPRSAEPGDSCATIADCLGEQELACSQSVCVRLSCQRSAECPAGAACVAGLCALPECGADDDCLGRMRCFEGDCRSDVCEFKAECARGEVCNGDPPTCRLPPAKCDEDRDCANDTFCQLPERICERRCTSDVSCPDESYCDGEFCRLRCQTRADCAALDACVDGRCEPVTCGAQTCSDDAPFLDPVTCSCVSCLDDSDCAVEAQFGCSTANRCITCLLKSDDSSVCAGQGLKLFEGCCVGCIEDRDCRTGSVCENNRCVLADPRECVFDEDCPSGARCDLGFCVQPGSQTACQTQTDCPDGEACYGDGRCRAESDVCVDCDVPNRCVAEPGDPLGSCVGCSTTCDETGCGSRVCLVPTGAAEGFCAAPETVDCP